MSEVVSKALTVWEEDLMGKAHNTRKAYKANLNKFLERWSLSPDELFDLRRDSLKSEDPRDVQKVERMVRVQMAEMREEGYAANTCMLLAKGAASFLESQGMPLKLRQRDIPKGYANGQSLAMKEHIRGMWDYAPTENKLKARALIMLLKDSGLRVSDASALNLKHYSEAKRVDHEGEIFVVFKPLETEKTKAPAHIHLGPEAMDAIEAYLEEPREWNPTDKDPEEPLFLNRFGRRSSADTLGQLFVRLAKLLKAENVSAHSLRKYHTTTLQGAGMNDSWIKVLQGKTIQGSMAAYTRPYESGALTEAYIKAYPRLRVFGQEASAQLVKEQADEIEALRRQIDNLERQVRDGDPDTKRELAEVKELVVDLLELIGTNPERLSRLARRPNDRVAPTGPDEEVR